MIEIIPKPAAKLPLWSNILFYFSIAILLASIFCYFILNNSLKSALETLQNLERSLNREKTPQELALEEEVLGYQKKINDFSFLISSHKNLLSFFSVLEDSSHPQVQFINISLVPGKLKVVFSGKADSFQTVGQQIYLFQGEPLIKNVDLTSLLLGEEGGAIFSMTLSLNPRIFK